MRREVEQLQRSAVGSNVIGGWPATAAAALGSSSARQPPDQLFNPNLKNDWIGHEKVRTHQLQLYAIQKRAKGVSPTLQPVNCTVDHVGGSLRRGRQVIDNKGNTGPGQNFF